MEFDLHALMKLSLSSLLLMCGLVHVAHVHCRSFPLRRISLSIVGEVIVYPPVYNYFRYLLPPTADLVEVPSRT